MDHVDLPIETQILHVVDYSDLTRFVNEVYGFEAEPVSWSKTYKEWPYSFIAIEECGNDTACEFTVDGEIDEGWEEDQIHEWRKSGGKSPYISNSAILNDLCRKDKIPAGQYLVRVSW